MALLRLVLPSNRLLTIMLLLRGLVLRRSRRRCAGSAQGSVARMNGAILAHPLRAQSLQATAVGCEAIARQHGGVSRHATSMARPDGYLALGVVGRGSLAAGSRASTVVVHGDLGLDAAPVRSIADLREERADGLDQAVLLRRSGEFQSCLNDVIAEGVSQIAVDLLGSKQLVDNHVFGLGSGASETLFDHIGAKLVTRQRSDAALERLDDGVREARLIEIDDVLDDVVAEGVLHENTSVARDAVNQPRLLVAGGVVDATLEHAASMSMRAHIDAVVANCIEDELGIGRSELVQTLLDNVVAVEVLDELNNSEAQRLDDESDLLSSVDELDHLL